MSNICRQYYKTNTKFIEQMNKMMNECFDEYKNVLHLILRVVLRIRGGNK